MPSQDQESQGVGVPVTLAPPYPYRLPFNGDDEKWRVCAAITPTVETPGDRPGFMAVWAIWPPLWPITGQPLLMYRNWQAAYAAAADRADFNAAPPPPEREIEWLNTTTL
jgi:hypothetical protein